MDGRSFVGMSLVVALALLVLPLIGAAQDGEPGACPGAPESRLVVGGAGRVTPGAANRMRDQPSPGGAEVGSIPGGAWFAVLDGPVCADGFAWWQVEYEGVIGWTVEGSGEDYWVEPVAQAGLVFASEGNGESQIFTVDLQGENLTSLGEPGVYQLEPMVSPDGTRIAYVGERLDGSSFLGIMTLDGGERRVLSEGESHYYRDVAWSPDGTQLAFRLDTDLGAEEDNANLYVINADGSDLRALTSGTIEHSDPAWSPDGTQIAFAANYDGMSTQLHVLDVASGAVRQITAGDYSAGSPSWSPDGAAIGFGAFVPGAESPNTGQVFVVDADGSNPRQPTGAGLHATEFAWSPDGSRLVFMAIRDDDADMEVYTVNADGSDLRRLTDNEVADSCPAWSPDGTQIAFISLLDVDPDEVFKGDVYVMDADGGNLRRLTDDGRRDRCPQWVP